MRLLCAGAAERLPSSSGVGAAAGSASEDVPRIGKPKKRVSWRAGSLDDVAQASASHAGLATAEEMAQEQQQRFTWKVLHLSLYWATWIQIQLIIHPSQPHQADRLLDLEGSSYVYMR